jgi:hypothetical protein
MDQIISTKIDREERGIQNELLTFNWRESRFSNVLKHMKTQKLMTII